MSIRSTRLFFPSRRRQRLGGFTLLELMIAVGILAILTALLLATVRKSVETARRVSCLSNVRSLTAAILQYAADNDSVLPDAASTNSAQSQLSPLSQNSPAGTMVKGTQYYVLPSIGQLLQPYLSNGFGVWTCPSAANQPAVVRGDDPFSGFKAPNQFLPQYDYLASKDLIQFAITATPLTDITRLRTWVTRSVSGLRSSKLLPLGADQRVVLIHDRDSSYHTRFKSSIYTAPTDADYFQNFGYLDGHAEGKAFRNANEYLACIHGPIRQSWCGIDFTTAFPEQYSGY